MLGKPAPTIISKISKSKECLEDMKYRRLETKCLTLVVPSVEMLGGTDVKANPTIQPQLTSWSKAWDSP